MYTAILTTQQAADLLHVSPAYLRGMAAKGEIPGTQIGDDWRFVQQDLIDCISQRAKLEQLRRKQATQPPLPTQHKRGRGRPSKKLIDLAKYQGLTDEQAINTLMMGEGA